MRIIKRVIARVLNPTMIFRLRKTSKEADDFFKIVIENISEVEECSACIVKFRNCYIWIANVMYASPRVYNNYDLGTLPYADTTVEFFEALEKELFKRALKKS